MAANFGLTPSAAHDGVLDYTTVAHAKIYSEAIKPVEPAFDCTAGGLKVFLSRIADKATGYGWTTILEVPQDIAHPDDDLMNILTEYGRISIQQVRDHVQTYLANQSRAAQESMQLYMCLKASLTKEGEAMIMLQADSFTVNNVQSGVLLLKVIINESYIDTNATTRTIRDNLAALDSYMVAIESDITAFNRYVTSLLDSLHARGETTTDILPNLFKGYKAASDKTFRKWIIQKSSDYDDGQDLDKDTLMNLAGNKYKILTVRKEWNAPTEEESKIIALEAKVQKLSSNKKSNKPSETGKNKNSAKSNSNANKAKGKANVKPDWMLIPPKEGESNSKTVNNKQYWWCPNHNCWTRHKPTECKGVGINKGDNKDKGGDNKQRKLTQALAAIAESDDGED